MICKELNKEFTDKVSMFAELKANKELIIKEKKSQIFKSCDKNSTVPFKPLKLDAIKGLKMSDECLLYCCKYYKCFRFSW